MRRARWLPTPSYDLEALITTLRASVSLPNKHLRSTRPERAWGGMAERTHVGEFTTYLFPRVFFTLLTWGKGVRIYGGGAG